MARSDEFCARCGVLWDDHVEVEMYGWFPIPLCGDELKLVREGRDPFERYKEGRAGDEEP
jgi:hypothetical protein